VSGFPQGNPSNLDFFSSVSSSSSSGSATTPFFSFAPLSTLALQIFNCKPRIIAFYEVGPKMMNFGAKKMNF
jgi:hypothetical protein